MIEPEVRILIDAALRNKGWDIDPSSPSRNVFIEDSVKAELSPQAKRNLGAEKPDYTLFFNQKPIAIIEAKKDAVRNLQKAMEQAYGYAEKMGGVPFLFVCNGHTIKTQYFSTSQPLRIDGVEVSDFLSPEDISKFRLQNSNELFTIPDTVIRGRKDLIQAFSYLNNQLRDVGVRAGIERFTEFANFLFLKLLSEYNGNKGHLWDDVAKYPLRNVIDYINKVAVPQLKKAYGGEVIGPTIITDETIARSIVTKLDNIKLTSVDEDVKGTAFEHFIQKTTDTQNDLGEYYTPRHIVRFMVALLNPQFKQSVYDPFCGTGGFLTEAFKHISKGVSPTKHNADILQKDSVFGGELTTTARVAKMNMILFGDGHSGVKKQNSIKVKTASKYDNVLTNIPFSQGFDIKNLTIAGEKPETQDGACVLKCFESLKDGGSMAIVVPEGILFNRKNKSLRRFLFKNAWVRMVVRLPSGCFAPYTGAKTAIIYLTDKNLLSTEWFYLVKVVNHGYDGKRKLVPGINDLDETLFYYSGDVRDDKQCPASTGNSNIVPVNVSNLKEDEDILFRHPWSVNPSKKYLRLDAVATLDNGQVITEKNTGDGDIPVIAGGETVPYYHDQSNFKDGFTISRSGNAGYLWWHDKPVWASDSIMVKSKDESKFLSKFLFLCMSAKQDEIYHRQQGTAQPHIYIYHVEDFPIVNISVKQQREIIAGYEKLEKTRADLKQRLADNEDDIGRFLLSLAK